MDIISFNEASTANSRIEKVIANPDSSSGIITVPKVIATGETITIPEGRVAILPDVQVDGTLNVEGDVFIPTGASINTMVSKVAMTDNSIVRANGNDGEIQGSGVYIDDNSNVGIGTSNPSNKLHIYNSSGWNKGVGVQSLNKFIQMSSDSNVGNDIFWDNASILRFSTGSASDATGYAERMRITSSGNLLVGTSTDNGIDKLQVNGSITSVSSFEKYSNLNDANTINEHTIVANTCLNIPVNDYGYVTIQVSTPYTFCVQTFIGLNGPARIFIRVLAGGIWSAWVEK